MTSPNEFIEVCSVREMAHRLGLSRARFYQLQKMGVFPPPVYCIRTRRPLYPLCLQKVCIHIRKTGIGDNGQLSVFYAPHKTTRSRTPAPKSKAKAEECYSHLVNALKAMGIKTNAAQVRTAVQKRFPNGLTLDQIDGAVIANLFQHFKSGGRDDV
jgi:hypothetical protein